MMLNAGTVQAPVFVPAAPGHLLALNGGAPEDLMGRVENTAGIICNEFSWAAVVGGEAVMAAGILVHWRGEDREGRACGYGEAWARVGDVPIRAWPAITRFACAEADPAQESGIRLIEATVDVGFAAGHRWVQRLGFGIRCLRPGWGVTGNDGVLYQRIRGAR